MENKRCSVKEYRGHRLLIVFLVLSLVFPQSSWSSGNSPDITPEDKRPLPPDVMVRVVKIGNWNVAGILREMKGGRFRIEGVAFDWAPIDPGLETLDQREAREASEIREQHRARLAVATANKAIEAKDLAGSVFQTSLVLTAVVIAGAFQHEYLDAVRENRPVNTARLGLIIKIGLESIFTSANFWGSYMVSTVGETAISVVLRFLSEIVSNSLAKSVLTSLLKSAVFHSVVGWSFWMAGDQLIESTLFHMPELHHKIVKKAGLPNLIFAFHQVSSGAQVDAQTKYRAEAFQHFVGTLFQILFLNEQWRSNWIDNAIRQKIATGEVVTGIYLVVKAGQLGNRLFPGRGGLVAALFSALGLIANQFVPTIVKDVITALIKELRIGGNNLTQFVYNLLLSVQEQIVPVGYVSNQIYELNQLMYDLNSRGVSGARSLVLPQNFDEMRAWTSLPVHQDLAYIALENQIAVAVYDSIDQLISDYQMEEPELPTTLIDSLREVRQRVMTVFFEAYLLLTTRQNEAKIHLEQIQLADENDVAATEEHQKKMDRVGRMAEELQKIQTVPNPLLVVPSLSLPLSLGAYGYRLVERPLMKIGYKITIFACKFLRPLLVARMVHFNLRQMAAMELHAENANNLGRVDSAEVFKKEVANLNLLSQYLVNWGISMQANEHPNSFTLTPEEQKDPEKCFEKIQRLASEQLVSYVFGYYDERRIVADIQKADLTSTDWDDASSQEQLEKTLHQIGLTPQPKFEPIVQSHIEAFDRGEEVDTGDTGTQ